MFILPPKNLFSVSDPIRFAASKKYYIIFFLNPENVVMKDNPTFSMINDSEEEDITTTIPSKARGASGKLSLYASEDDDDEEDILCPLNRATAQNRTDESD